MFHFAAQSVTTQEILLYEIGVHHAYRRMGVGRKLIDEMLRKMKKESITEARVLADNPTAVDFYIACGFSTQDEMSVYMVLSTDGKGDNRE